jgi:uncharacterized repeat protein (TIGR03843 family)
MDDQNQQHEQSQQEDPTQPADQPVAVDTARVLKLLSDGEMRLVGLMPDSSNYTFLAEVDDGALQSFTIYKPRRGERPLWDFPRGTLSYRELAAYLVSEALGWGIVPPTVLRDGPEHGIGSVQIFIDNDPELHYFALRGIDDATFQRIAAFDIITNNADRKGGHVLYGRDGHIWGIDHGITFHSEPKLRTVIWEYAGQPIPRGLVADIERIGQQLADPGDALTEALGQLLHRTEVDALRRRIERLLRRPVFPDAYGGRAVPWPPI